MDRIRKFLFMFLAQFLSYGLICWNYRAVAQGRLVQIAVSDLAFAGVNFTLIRRIAEAKTRVEQAGYILGGACGSIASVALTKYIYGS